MPFQSYRKIEGKLCLCEVFQRESGWFAAIVVDLPVLPFQIEGRLLAIDLGAINTAACVDDKGQPVLYSGRGLLAIQYYFNKQIAKVQHRLTTRDRKASPGLRALHRKRNRQLSQNLHKISKHIVATCVEQQITTIVVGNLRHLRKKMQFHKKTNLKTHAWAFAKFTAQLRYKAQRHGIRVVAISEQDTSKTCSHCRQGRKQNRVERGLYQCQACGCTMNADLNGATNLLNKYLQSQGFPARVVLAPLAVPVVRMVEKPKGDEPISERPPTAILPAMGESPILQ
jgi:putative transposase